MKERSLYGQFKKLIDGWQSKQLSTNNLWTYFVGSYTLIHKYNLQKRNEEECEKKKSEKETISIVRKKIT